MSCFVYNFSLLFRRASFSGLTVSLILHMILHHKIRSSYCTLDLVPLRVTVSDLLLVLETQ